MKRFLVILLSLVAVFAFANGNSEKGSDDTMMMESSEDENTMMMSEDNSSMHDDTMMENDVMSEEPVMEMDGGHGGLMEFMKIEDPQMYAESGPAVLFFYADWCPSCKTAIKEFRSMSDSLGDIALYVVNYDTASDLKRKYAVTYQHTFVQIDGEGNAITTWNGGGIAELKQNVKRGAM